MNGYQLRCSDRAARWSRPSTLRVCPDARMLAGLHSLYINTGATMRHHYTPPNRWADVIRAVLVWSLSAACTLMVAASF
jgi:hypothetical protein